MAARVAAAHTAAGWQRPALLLDVSVACVLQRVPQRVHTADTLAKHIPACMPALPPAAPHRSYLSTPAARPRTCRSLKKWKADMARALAQQKGRRFEPGDAAKLYGMF